MRNLSVVIETGTSSDGLRVHVTDEVSRLAIMSFTLGHADAARFMMGQASSQPVSAEVVDANWGRLLGRKCYTYTRTFKIEDSSISRDLRDDDEPPALALWADVVRSDCWAHSTSWRLQNQGRLLFTMRRYCNELTDEQDADIRRQLAAAPAPKGLVSA